MFSNSSSAYDFHGSLTMEARWLPKVPGMLPGCELQNVSKHTKFQPLGVDFLVRREGPLPTGLEGKFDRYLPLNFALEGISQDRPSSARAPAVTDGWMLTCQAGWLMYAFVKTGDFFVLDMAVLRAWWAANYHRFPSTSVANQQYFSYCVLAPVATVCRELPKEAWHWVDLRKVLGEPFDSSPTPHWIRAQETPAADLKQIFSAGTRRSAPLQFTENDYRALHTHLWTKNKKYAVHSVPGDTRQRVLKRFPLCAALAHDA